MTASPSSSSVNRGPALLKLLRNVEALVRSGDVTAAAAMAGDAVARGHEHVNLLILAAYDQLNRGASDRALALAVRATDADPNNADAQAVLGLSLATLNRLREAVSAFDAALRQCPSAAHLHFHRGRALEDLDDLAGARISFERTVAHQPAHAEALARLAFFAALRADTVRAHDYANRSLRHDPNGAAAHLALALADIQEKEFDRAISRLLPITKETNPSSVNRAIAQALLGDALDGLGRSAEAFLAYGASKSALRASYRPLYEARGTETALQRAGRLMAYFHAAPESSWRAHTPQISPNLTHVFLVGFPRSGTTLLEQILDSHTDVETMPERDCLSDAISDFILGPDGLNRLANADESTLASYRALYWKRAGEYGHGGRRKVFVDKMPLNTVLLCLVVKLFPEAKVLRAIRDPRDVVLSCFRRRFAMTQQMYELLTLEGAAKYYDAVMRLSEIYRARLGLSFYDIRYETLAKDFDAEARKLCAFLGMSFDRRMRDFAVHARAKEINTPSSVQVVRGIYTDGIGQWRRYRHQLEPVLPMLAPWVTRFGYEEE